MFCPREKYPFLGIYFSVMSRIKAPRSYSEKVFFSGRFVSTVTPEVVARMLKAYVKLTLTADQKAKF